MRVLFDLKHPAQVLFFKDAIGVLRREGHAVLVTSREKDETLPLLDELGIGHTRISRMGHGLAGMGLELAVRTARMHALARRFRPDVLVARTGVTAGIVGRLLHVPSITFDDTEFAWLQIMLCAPMCTLICTGLGYGRRFPGKELRMNAPFHLAYTHPSRFRPDAGVLREGGIDPEQPYVVLRLKAWRALHDLGVEAPAQDELAALVEEIGRRARPVITSERPLPAELRRYANPLPVRHGLHLLAFARLYVGEGSCSAAEAACLGTPAIFISPASRRGYLDEMERRYGHVTTVRTVQEARETAVRWLGLPDLAARGREARQRLVRECDDPLDVMLDVIRRYGGA